jgi:hypothetical protein
MQDASTEEEYTFHCDRWLSREKDDCDVVREFPISRKTGTTPACMYHYTRVYCNYLYIS